MASLASYLSINSAIVVFFNLLTLPINLEFSAFNSTILLVKFAASLLKRIF